MVFPTFFILSLNLAIRSSWSETQSVPGLVFVDCIELLHLWLQRIQSDFGIDHLVISMCRVFSLVVGRGCLLWPVHSLGKTLLAFDLLHFVLQGQICLLLQISLDFLLLHLESHLEFAFFKNHLQVFSIFSVVTQRKESYFLFLILRGHKAGYLFNFLFPLTSRNYFKVSGFYLFIYLNSILFIYFFWSSENFFKSFYFIYKELVLFSA